jgi:hypothetical protein
VATPFAEQEAGTTRRQQRLHADDQGRHASRQTLLDGHEHPAQIERVHQQAGNADVDEPGADRLGHGARGQHQKLVIRASTRR